MKVLFLDIDGVLNNEESMVQGIHLHAPLVRRLNQILDDSDVRIVISSSWRILFPGETIIDMLWTQGFVEEYISSTDIQEIILLNKKDEAKRLVGITDNDAGIRGEQIQRWLDANPEVTHYVILDDDSDMLPSQMDNFVNVPYRFGLTDEHVAEARRILELEA